MPREEPRKSFPREDAKVLIDNLLEEVRSVSNPVALNDCRSLFRSRVPLHLRSYVASALILKSLGIESVPRKNGKGFRPKGHDREAPIRKDGQTPGPLADRGPSSSQKPRPESKSVSEEESRLRKCLFAGEGTTLFFSMGRRQRFTAQNVLRVLSNISGIEETDIGRIRTFDNYTFVNVHPAAADLLIQDLDGTQYKGRKLVVNRARARKEDSKTERPEDRPTEKGSATE